MGDSKKGGKRSEWWFTTQVEFAILGPIEARLDEVRLPLGGPKQRAHVQDDPAGRAGRQRALRPLPA